MAKISTYPNVSTPTLSDMLIGTEVADNNATKNFSISDILGLIGPLGLYVPYTGANANVDLGTFTLSSGGADFFGPVYLDDVLLDSTGNPGTIGQILSSTVTGTQWVNASSIGVPLQLVLNTGNTADQDIILTGANNIFDMTGANSLFRQTGASSIIRQTGATAFISQTGAAAFITQAGANAYFEQQGVNAIITQLGQFSYFHQQGDNSFIWQTGLSSYFEQQGANAFILQTGLNSYISQTGLNGYILQTGDNGSFTQSGLNSVIQQNAGLGSVARIVQSGENSFFQQQGANAYIEQTGANASIRQTNPNAYMEPAQIKDGAASYGTAGQVLSSLGPNLGLRWTNPFYSATFFDTTDQPNGGATVANQVRINSTQQATGLSLGTNRIDVLNAGIYFIGANLQLAFSGGASAPYNVTVWFTINDVIVPNSAFTFSTSSAQNDQTLAALTDTVALAAGDYIKFFWWSTVTGMRLLTTAAGINPTRPFSPSVNINMFNVG